MSHNIAPVVAHPKIDVLTYICVDCSSLPARYQLNKSLKQKLEGA